MKIANGPLWCLLYIVVLLLATTIKSIFAEEEQQSSTGVYANDDRLDRTVENRVDVLSILDLPEKQTTTSNDDDDDDDDDDTKKQNSASSARYIRGIYESIVNGSSVDSEPATMGSDIIMTYARTLDDDNLKNRLHFDVSRTPTIGGVVKAQLHFYSDGSLLDGDRRLSIYQPEDCEPPVESGRWTIIDIVRIEANRRGWLTIDVYEYLDKCVNHGRELVFRLKLNGSGKGDRSRLLRFMSQEAFVVAYYESRNSQSLDRSLSADRWKRSKAPPAAAAAAPPWRKQRKKASEGACRLHQLYVRFGDLQAMPDYVVAPDGFEAGYCAGGCRFPLSADAHTTNHAIVQTMMHVLRPDRAPETCCAPAGYGDVAVLIVSEDAKTHTIKRYPRMRVTECTCQ
ncbi:protein 60A-like [Trichogramma pretiosum]|uniref:protein 60A-like n=1 Tax=Trichogramma pretiosum TaxID=7493 RepID=UPI0006C9DF41|nr:protein 60A-like [Trichogramma pretiosum]